MESMTPEMCRDELFFCVESAEDDLAEAANWAELLGMADWVSTLTDARALVETIRLDWSARFPE